MNKEIKNFINTKFNELKNEENAKWSTAYMKNNFKFLGVRDGRKIMAEMLKQFTPNLDEIVPLAEYLYTKEYREYQYFAIYLLEKYAKELNESHINMLENMIIQDSWWDSVDLLSANVIGVVLFGLSIEERKKYLDKWENSGNIWLLRVCIIHQLKYKINTDINYLAYICEKSKNHTNFFIRKAIGWALREYSKINYSWVEGFVEQNQNISPLSKKEALKLVKYKNN